MIDPKDRMLELGLRRMLREEADAPDLAPRVLEAWNNGTRAPVVRVRDLANAPEEEPEEAASNTHRWPVTIGLAAALTLAAGVGLWRLGGSQSSALVPGDPGTPATASGLAIGEPWMVSETTALPGIEGFADAGTVLAQEGDGALRLASGAMRIVAQGRATAVLLPGEVRLDLLPGTNARIELSLDRPPASAAPGVLEAWWSKDRDQAHGVLILEVAGSAATLHWLGGSERAGTEGQSRYYLGPAGLAKDEGQGAELAGELAKLGAADLPLTARLELWARASLDGPLMALRDQPALWVEAQPLVAEYLESEAAPDGFQTMLVDALAQDPSPVALGVLRTAWMEVPENFSSDSITALADQGIPEFEREVRRVFDHWNVAGGAPGDALPFALWLAFEGRGDGALALAEALDFDRTDPEGRFRTGAAAAGLARLGDRREWIRFRKSQGARIEKSLEAQDLNAATVALAGLEYLTALLESRPLPLPGYEVQTAFAGKIVQDYAQARLASYAIPEQIRAGLEAVLR